MRALRDSEAPSRALFAIGEVFTGGGTGGLDQIKYRPRDASDLDLQLKTRNSTIAAPVGPLRVTYVLGSTQAASDGGQCAISATIPCTTNGSGSTLRCE